MLTQRFHTNNNIKTYLMITCTGNLIPLLQDAINSAAGLVFGRQ